MGTDGTIAAPSGALLGAVERAAWGIRLPTRRLFLVAAVAVAAALAAGSVAAAWLTARNADTIARTRATGLGIASAAIDFRVNLAAADTAAATTLIAGGLETADDRDQYEQGLREAERALDRAGLLAPADDGAELAALGEGLIRYAGLVETARANTRQGFPVGAAYLSQARDLARDDLLPRSARLRRVGEQRVARAANSVGGPSGAIAVGLPVVALAVLSASWVVIAGRTRRVTHPALVAAAVGGVATLAVVTVGVLGQGRELREAATGDIDAYVAANDAAFALSGLRLTEIEAVAARRPTGPLYGQLQRNGEALAERLAGDPGRAPLHAEVQRYLAAVEDVEAADRAGETAEGPTAADITLAGASAEAFAAADESARAAVAARAGDLRARFEAAADAELHPVVPVALGAAAAALAAAGVLARGRRYR